MTWVDILTPVGSTAKVAWWGVARWSGQNPRRCRFAKQALSHHRRPWPPVRAPVRHAAPTATTRAKRISNRALARSASRDIIPAAGTKPEVARAAGAPSRLGAIGETTAAPRYGAALDAWARLWVAYNVMLTAATFLSLGRVMLDSWVLTQVIIAALIANVCFMLGPSIEFAARRLGYRGTTLRWTLFVVGLALALTLTLGACMDFHAHRAIVPVEGR